MSAVPNVDSVTQRVLENAFRSICDEMGHTMLRTANSAIFVEGRDFSCALVDRNAELVAAANFDPSHLSAMALTVEFALTYFGHDQVVPGDVYLVNDPYRGGGHLPDITLIRPVFADTTLIGFAVNRAHHIDVGGIAVASFSGTAHSIYQEGLRIPPVRWYAGGVENRDIIEMITLNMRFPRDQLGDFQAQLSSTHVAERRLVHLAQRYGADTVVACMDEAQAHSEGLMRAILRDIPDGTYSFDEFLDDDGVGDRPYRIHVAVTIAGNNATVDFTGTSPQAAGPMNSSYGNTLSSTFNALLQLAGPEVAFNAGCFRPIEMIAPRGCLLNPVPPAPCFGGVTEVSIRIIDAILGALAPVARDRAGAGSYGTCLSFSGGGFDSARGETFAFYFFTEGGWGACAWRDGWSVTPNPTSNFTDYPIEWLESTLPLRFTEVRLNTDSGGAGRYRGGVGVVRSFEVAADAVEINGLGERFQIPPFGLEGGAPGGLNAVLVRAEKDAEWRSISEMFRTVSPSKFHGVKAGAGLHFSMVTGGGGGYGRAIERPPQEVVRDVEYGYVSISGALGDYGVVIAEGPDGTLITDAAATASARTSGKTTADDRAARYRLNIDKALENAVVAGNSQVQAEVNAVTALVARAQSRISQDGIADSHAAPGHSLRNPFLNDRALAYWDTDALTRWASRHRFRLE